MGGNILEQMARAKELIDDMLEDAPKQVRDKIELSIDAVNQKNLGEALNKLRQAQAIVDKENLEDWQAELLAIWAYYYYAMGEEDEVRQCIEEAHRLEPNNKRLREVIKSFRAE